MGKRILSFMIILTLSSMGTIIFAENGDFYSESDEQRCRFCYHTSDQCNCNLCGFCGEFEENCTCGVSVRKCLNCDKDIEDCNCAMCKICGFYKNRLHNPEVVRECKCRRCEICYSHVDKNRKEPTCQEEGFISYTCRKESCNHIDKEILPKVSCQMMQPQPFNCMVREYCKWCGKKGNSGEHVEHHHGYPRGVKPQCILCGWYLKIVPEPPFVNGQPWAYPSHGSRHYQ